MRMDRLTILDAIKAARRRACCYMGDTCDCKYGAVEKDHMSPFQYPGEQTGCPELRDVIWILECMNDEQYADLYKQAHDRMIERAREFSNESLTDGSSDD